MTASESDKKRKKGEADEKKAGADGEDHQKAKSKPRSDALKLLRGKARELSEREKKLGSRNEFFRQEPRAKKESNR